MRILVFHGYLLKGTGSNIYNANLARSLAGLGHEVHLFCQERDAGQLAWVDAVGDWGGGALEVRETGEGAGPGRITVYTPPIGRLLPVYVEDRYEGFDARAFPSLDEAEIERYVEVNVEAVRDVIEAAGPPEAALANHLVMGPVILARSGISAYAVKNHGSDLEYTVKPHPRFVPWAREGLEPAAAVLVGSRHTAESMWEAIPDLDLESKTGLGPPGIDPGRFHPIPPGEKTDRLLDLADRIRGADREGGLGRDQAEAANALEWFAEAGPRVVFVGKLIVSKGVDLLAMAWPLVHRESPGAGLLFAGFGEFRAGLEALVGALSIGDREGVRRIVAEGRGLEGGEAARLRMVESFLEDAPAEYWQAAREAAGSIRFTGRLEHDEVASLVPATDAMVVPSTFPEAFGMVAAEAAASGVLPLSADHSGLAEVTGVLAREVPGAAPFLTFTPGPAAVSEIATRLSGWLARSPGERQALGGELARIADSLWSWDGVARDVIRASAGDIRPLPER